MKSRHDLAAVAFLAVLVTAFFAKELVTDRTLVTFRLANSFPWLAEATREDLAEPSVTSDCTLSYYPRRVFATEAMRQGRIPFWNPHQFCGTPFFANFQSAVLYPVNLAIYWMSPETQMDVFLYVHFLVAALFGYLLGRRLKFSRAAAVVSALAYTFSSFMVTRLGQPTLVSTASWFPALVYFAEGLVEAPSLRRAGLVSLALALTILAGFPQVVLFAVYTVVLYVALRILLGAPGPARSRLACAVLLGVSLAIACLVCAFQLLPTQELSSFSYRKTLPYSMILSSAHHKLVALKYFIPDILGDPLEMGVISKALTRVDEGPRFAQNYVSTVGYVGILPLVLALVALTRLDRKTAPFAVLAALSLLVVFGSPLLRLLYGTLPGFNFSRIDRVIVVFMLGLAVLAGRGYDLARSGGDAKRRLVVGAGFLAFAVALVVWLRQSGIGLILRETGASISRQEYLAYASGKMAAFVALAAFSGALVALAGRRGLRPAGLLAAALAILLVDLLPKGTMFKVSQPADEIVPPSSLVARLGGDDGQWRLAKYRNDVLPANLATVVGLEDVHGYDALNVRHYVEVLGVVDSTVIDVANAALRRRIGPISSQEGLSSPVLDLLNVKYVLSTSKAASGRREVATLINTDYLARAFLVERARFFPDYDGVLAYMKTGGFDPRREVLLGGEPAGGRPAEERPAGDAEPGRVGAVKYRGNGLTVGVDARAKCYLVLSDVFYPGWRAFVDGKPAPLLRADYAFRAVEVEAGAHEVRMVYKPVLFTIGVVFSVAGMALVALMIASGGKRTDGGTPAGGGLS
ncbi:MAG: YfhO family protein [bacterium]